MAPSPISGVFIREKFGQRGDCHMKMDAKIGINTSTMQEMPMIASNCENLGQRHGSDFAAEVSEGTNPLDIWILEFLPLQL